MKRAVARITEAARAAKMPVMVLVSGMEDAAEMRDLGATAYVVSNDQNFLKSAAKNAREAYGDPARWRAAPAGKQPGDGMLARLQARTKRFGRRPRVSHHFLPILMISERLRFSG